MKILQIVPYFYPAWSYGGTPRVVYELSRELAVQGDDVTVFTTDVRLAIVRPDDGARRFLEDLIEKLGIKERVFFIG